MSRNSGRARDGLWARDQPLSLPGRVPLNGTVATVSPWLFRIRKVCPDTSSFCLMPLATRSRAPRTASARAVSRSAKSIPSSLGGPDRRRERRERQDKSGARSETVLPEKMFQSCIEKAVLQCYIGSSVAIRIQVRPAERDVRSPCEPEGARHAFNSARPHAGE